MPASARRRLRSNRPGDAVAAAVAIGFERGLLPRSAD
jgi:hypothetical protein